MHEHHAWQHTSTTPLHLHNMMPRHMHKHMHMHAHTRTNTFNHTHTTICKSSGQTHRNTLTVVLLLTVLCAMRNETKPQNVNTFIWLGKMKHTVQSWNITAMETNVPCNHVSGNTCAQTQTHTLPGLCHSAAVTATALRAPAHSQLLLRLTAIKVISEFSKTRHLCCFRSPPVLELSLPFEPLS